jgi:hypothetical protein
MAQWIANPATEKDHSEVRQKKEAYDGYMNWGIDKGVLKDLAEIFHVQNPPLKFLLPIAQCMAVMMNIELDRQDKRRREVLIGWFNKNYDSIGPVMRNMVLIDTHGRANGPLAGGFEQFSVENPSHDVMVYLNGERGIA